MAGLQNLENTERFWKLPVETLALGLYSRLISLETSSCIQLKLIDTKKSLLQYFHGDKKIVYKKIPEPVPYNFRIV